MLHFFKRFWLALFRKYGKNCIKIQNFKKISENFLKIFLKIFDSFWNLLKIVENSFEYFLKIFRFLKICWKIFQNFFIIFLEFSDKFFEKVFRPTPKIILARALNRSIRKWIRFSKISTFLSFHNSNLSLYRISKTWKGFKKLLQRFIQTQTLQTLVKPTMLYYIKS